MSTHPVTLRIRWAKRRQIQPPPPIAQEQFRTVEEAFYEKQGVIDGPVPPIGSDYVLHLSENWTSEHKVEAVQWIEDDRGTATLAITLSDYNDHGDSGREDLEGAGFTEI